VALKTVEFAAVKTAPVLLVALNAVEVEAVVTAAVLLAALVAGEVALIARTMGLAQGAASMGTEKNEKATRAMEEKVAMLLM
jgi:hypothetical protein